MKKVLRYLGIILLIVGVLGFCFAKFGQNTPVVSPESTYEVANETTSAIETTTTVESSTAEITTTAESSAAIETATTAESSTAVETATTAESQTAIETTAVETTAVSKETKATEAEINRDGAYTTKEDVALYLYTYGVLPENFLTKKQAQAKGWQSGGLDKYVDGGCIGGDKFGNFEGVLPSKKGRQYYECDIDTLHKKQRGAKRIVFSNDGLIYYTEDHYSTFELLYENAPIQMK